MQFVSSATTFLVEELPAYLPAGEGPHTFLWIEKRDFTTHEAVRRIATVLGVDARDMGYAGQKDRHATTLQWLSAPGVAPEKALAIEIEGIRVLRAERHGNKLRTGHLRGNRFEVVLEQVTEAEAAAVESASTCLDAKGYPTATVNSGSEPRATTPP